MRKRLPRTALDVVELRPVDWLLYRSLIAFHRLTGRWRFPTRAQGDLERMTTLDKAYWLHKVTRPIRHAVRGSGLEAFFERQASSELELPHEFETLATLELSAVGDLMNHELIPSSKDGLYADIWDRVFAADVSMANLECPVVGEKKGDLVIDAHSAPMLHLDAERFDVVKGWKGRNFTFMATACNHSLDFGASGADATLRALDERGIAHNGVNVSEAAALHPTIIDTNDIRLGVVAYTFGLNAHHPPAGRPNIVNRLALNDGAKANDFSQLEQQIANAHAKGADFFIAHLHWGMEHELYPRPEQIELAHALAELGVDAIIGHHPHVVQPMEYYRTRRDPDRVVPVYYSLGNFVNPFSATYLSRSGIARLTLAKGVTPEGEHRTYAAAARLENARQVADESTLQLRIVPD